MSDLIPHMELPVRILIVTPILLTFFIYVCWRAFSKKQKDVYEEISKSPLED
jgi:hypothetical protein